MDFLLCFGFFSKLLRLLLKVTKVITEHHQWPKMGQNRIISSIFLPEWQQSLGQSPPQEQEEGPHSGPYLLIKKKSLSFYTILSQSWAQKTSNAFAICESRLLISLRIAFICFWPCVRFLALWHPNPPPQFNPPPVPSPSSPPPAVPPPSSPSFAQIQFLANHHQGGEV